MSTIKRFAKFMTPIDANGKSVDISDFGDLNRIIEIGKKRCHRFALNMTVGRINLPEALSAAYIQGMSDAASVLQRAERISNEH